MALGILASVCPAVNAAVSDDVRGTRYEEPIAVLSALDIMVGDENGDYRPDDTIIRSEVAKMAVHVLGLEDAAGTAKGQQVFDDVSTDHWANGYINLAVSQGIIEGDGDGNFRPNSPITYAEAMTIMVRATGYTIPAEDKGGYPVGYMQTGMSNGLGDNVLGGASQEISRGNVAYLTENALGVNLMEQTGYSSDGKYEITDKTLLKDRLKVTKSRGQITAVENTSLNSGEGVGKNRVMINGKVFETEHSTNDLLGFNVDYYVKEYNDSTQKLILAMPVSSQNKELTLSADDFSKVTTKNGVKAVEYFDESSKSQTALIDTNAVLIYNGKYAAMSDELINLSDKSGKMTLLDTNRDNRYDVISVKTYENIVVDKVISNKISDKYSQTVLKLDEDDDISFRITKGFEDLALTDLKEYDVLSVSKSLDGTLCDIIVTTDTVEGKVTAFDSRGVVINGERYEIAKNYTKNITAGSEGVFCLDADGKIAAVKSAPSAGTNYGYLTKVYYSDNGDEALFRILTANNEELTFTANNKIKFNDVKNVKAEDAVSAVTDENGKTNAQLVTYGVNSAGKLTSLSTATASTSADENRFTRNYSLENAVYTSALSKLGNVKIGKDTVVFDVSEGENNYAVKDTNMFEDGQFYSALVYDMTNNYTAGAVVVTSATLSADANSSIAVVKEVLGGVNGDDEPADILEALTDSKEVSLYAANTNVLTKNGGKLETGDIIQYKTNGKNEIVSVRLLLDVNNKDSEQIALPAEDLVTVYGKVTEKFDDSINVSVNGGSEANYAIPTDAAVYSVDTLASRNNVTAADVTNIDVYDADENNRVFLKIYDNVVREIVIIR